MSKMMSTTIVVMLSLIVVGVGAIFFVALTRGDDRVEITGVVGVITRGRTNIILDGVDGLRGDDAKDVLDGGQLDGDSLAAALVNPEEDVRVGDEITGTYFADYNILFIGEHG